jgi:hypothetical protein
MRRTYGELLENVAASSEYHWMAGQLPESTPVR